MVVSICLLRVKECGSGSDSNWRVDVEEKEIEDERQRDEIRATSQSWFNVVGWPKNFLAEFRSPRISNAPASMNDEELAAVARDKLRSLVNDVRRFSDLEQRTWRAPPRGAAAQCAAEVRIASVACERGVCAALLIICCLALLSGRAVVIVRSTPNELGGALERGLARALDANGADAQRVLRAAAAPLRPAASTSSAEANDAADGVLLFAVLARADGLSNASVAHLFGCALSPLTCSAGAPLSSGRVITSCTALTDAGIGPRSPAGLCLPPPTAKRARPFFFFFFFFVIFWTLSLGALVLTRRVARCCAAPLGVDTFVHYCLALQRGDPGLGARVLAWLGEQHDASSAPLHLAPAAVLSLAHSFLGNSKNLPLELAYRTPPAVAAAGLASLSLALPRETVARLESGAPRHASLLDLISDHVHGTLHLPLGVLSLERASCAFGVIGCDGRVKVCLLFFFFFFSFLLLGSPSFVFLQRSPCVAFLDFCSSQLVFSRLLLFIDIDGGCCSYALSTMRTTNTTTTRRLLDTPKRCLARS